MRPALDERQSRLRIARASLRYGGLSHAYILMSPVSVRFSTTVSILPQKKDL